MLLTTTTLIAITAIASTNAFVTHPNVGFLNEKATASALWQHDNHNLPENENSASFVVNRRDVMAQSAAAAMATVVTSFASNMGPLRNVALAAEATTDIGTTPEHPIVIIGAGGKVGEHRGPTNRRTYKRRKSFEFCHVLRDFTLLKATFTCFLQ